MNETDKIIGDTLKFFYEKFKEESWILTSSEVNEMIDSSKPGLFKSSTIWYGHYYRFTKGSVSNIPKIIFGLKGGIIFSDTNFFISIRRKKGSELQDKRFSYLDFENTDDFKIFSILELSPQEINFIEELLRTLDKNIKNHIIQTEEKRKKEKIENVTFFSFPRTVGPDEGKVDFTFLDGEKENLVLVEFHGKYKTVSGKNPISDYTYRIEENKTNLKLVNESGSYTDGFFKEDRKKIEHFLDNLYFLKESKLSIKEFIDEVENKQKKEKNLVDKKVSFLLNEEFDKDNNGELDILEGDNLLMDLLEKNQSQITEFDHTLVQNIIRLNKFLNTKKKNLINIFNLLKTVEKDKDLEEVLLVLRKGIDNYQSLLIHSLNMVISLKEKQMITYYELYETFDSLGVFNSNWENEVSGKLSSIDSKLSDVISSIKEVVLSIRNMEDSITSSLDELTYSTKSSFEQLNTSVTSELKLIRSGIEWNNLLTGIQTYQTYKLRKGK